MLAEKIRFGDTIGIVSPAGPLPYEEIQRGIAVIKNLGFSVKEGNHIYDKNGYLAGSDIDRAKDLMDMFLDDEVKMVLCIRGGYGCMRLLPYINFNAIGKNPKIFAGFSDITVFLNTINKHCGFITFHSPMCNSDFSHEETLKSFLHTIMEGDSPYIIKNPKDYDLTGFSKETALGKLVGGNLSLICSLIGTSHEIEFENNILFIEEINETPYKIDRMFTQLILSERIQKCAGIILGQFTKCSLPHYERSFTLDEVINDRILNLNKPTLINFMSGHGYPKLTLPIGAEIALDCENKIIKVLNAVLK
ncbi:MAG: S66 peptidase family protein [Solirubrobacterales bacterium]